MQAYRQIVDVKSHSLNIYLPDDFKANRVEVIILPINDKQVKTKGIASLRGKLKLSDTQYNDFQEDVKNSHEG